MSLASPAPHNPDDITFELLLLNQVAQQRAKALPHPLAATLRASALWEEPVVERQRRPVPVWKAAVLAGLIALTPMAWLPVYADTQLKVGMNVIDARSGKAIAGARILSENGTLLGTTGPDGKITLVVPSGASDRFVIEKPGYRSFPVIRTQLRDNNLIAMLPAPKSAASPTGAPVTAQATPRPATPKPTARPATPKPPVRPATPAPTAKPVKPVVVPPRATPKPTPRPTEAPVVKPTVRPTMRPTEAPAAQPSAEFPTHAATPTTMRYKRYKVRPGDNLWKISKREYGDPMRWKVIYEVNRDVMKRSDMIQPGMILKLPTSSRQMIKQGWVFVKKGDSLYVLAERYLGNGERWPELYRANRQRIQNPRVIQPGQRLYIPKKGRKARTTRR